MWIEGVNHQEEGLRLPRKLQVVYGTEEYLRGEPVLLFFPVVRVGEVLADFFLHGVRIALYHVAVHRFF